MLSFQNLKKSETVNFNNFNISETVKIPETQNFSNSETLETSKTRAEMLTLDPLGRPAAFLSDTQLEMIRTASCFLFGQFSLISS